MNWLDRMLGREVRGSIENPTVPVSAENFLAFFGQGRADLPNITIDRALTVPAVWAAVSFLSRTLAALPLHAYRRSTSGAQRVSGKLASVIHDFPNDGQDSFKFRAWFWQQVFTGGRGLAWIERSDSGVEALWPMNPARTTIRSVAGRLVYRFEAREYPAADVIDVPFMLRADGVRHYGPIAQGAATIQLALAMMVYGAKFFAGGGVPPLALVGPLPQGPDAMKRAMGDIHRAVEQAQQSNKPIFPMPPGHELKQVGFDPAKGQMTEAMKHQVIEIARLFNLPPVFLQDLERATFTNSEQQDLHLVKYLIGQWAAALEGEMNLKLFGRMNRARYVEHNLDGLLRGDFKSRSEALARSIQAGYRTPQEARRLENLPDHPNVHAGDLFVQGATVPLGTVSGAAVPAMAPDPGSEGGHEAHEE